VRGEKGKGKREQGKRARKTNKTKTKRKQNTWKDLVMWQPVKVARGGIESVGVRGEPTTHATPFKTKPPAGYIMKKKRKIRK
jgi:hypothetical protein